MVGLAVTIGTWLDVGVAVGNAPGAPTGWVVPGIVAPSAVVRVGGTATGVWSAQLDEDTAPITTARDHLTHLPHRMRPMVEDGGRAPTSAVRRTQLGQFAWDHFRRPA